MIDYEYFMDRMADYELSIFLDNIDYAYVDEWEQTRLLLWGIIKVNASKNWNKQPKDLISLVTDGDSNTHKTADELTKEETERIKQLFVQSEK